MAVVKIQHKNCLQLRYSTEEGLRPQAILKTSGIVFPNTDLPAGK